MKAKIRKKLARGKRRNAHRLREIQWEDQPDPMFSAGTIHYDLAEKAQGLACGGIGTIHLLARQCGLVEAIDEQLHLLKMHKPCHESDHVLNIAYNLLCGGTCLEHIELRRNDAVFTGALGAQRIPDPTTAGDFCCVCSRILRGKGAFLTLAAGDIGFPLTQRGWVGRLPARRGGHQPTRPTTAAMLTPRRDAEVRTPRLAMTSKPKEVRR